MVGCLTKCAHCSRPGFYTWLCRLFIQLNQWPVNLHHGIRWPVLQQMELGPSVSKVSLTARS